MKKIPRLFFLAFFVFSSMTWIGCGHGVTKVPDLSEQEALERIKYILNIYIDGQDPGSELGNMERSLNSISEKSPEKAAQIENGFTELQKMRVGSTTIKKKAQEILDQLE